MTFPIAAHNRTLAARLLLTLSVLILALSSLHAQTGLNWRLRNPKPWGDSLTSVVATSATRVFATGPGTALMKSTDSGVTWTVTRLDPTSRFYNDGYVAWNNLINANSRMLLVQGNLAFTSTNGDSWTQVTTNLPDNSALIRLIYGNSKWSAIEKVQGSNSSESTYFLSTSTDGQTWTRGAQLPTVPGHISTFNSLAWAGYYYVAGGTHMTPSGENQGAYLMLQYAGDSTWTNIDLTGANDSIEIRGIAYTGTKVVAAGSGNNAYTTSDSVTWTRQNVGEDIDQIVWNGSKFVALAFNAGATSTDGVTWTSATTPVTGVQQLALAKMGTSVVSVGIAGSSFTTPDGSVWTQRGPTGPTDDLSSLAANPSGLLVAGMSYNGVFNSTDGGDTWTKTSGYFHVERMVWAGTRFVGITGNSSSSSADGVFWTNNDAIFNDDMMSGLASAGSLLVTVGYDASYNGVTYTSADEGATWTRGTVPAGTKGLTSVSRIGTQWVAVGMGSTILTSPNGTNWTKRMPGSAVIDLATVAGNSAGTLMIAMGTYGQRNYFTSTNGIAWTTRTLSDPYPMVVGLVWTGSQFIAANGGDSMITTDGINWTRSSLPTGSNTTAIAWDNFRQQALITGYSGVILSSDAVPDVSFGVASQTVFESGGTVPVQVNLSAPAPAGGLTIPFTVGGTATSGDDFTALVPASISFNAGETSKLISIPVLTDALTEGNETVTLTLNATTGIRLGMALTTHTLTIIDANTPPVAQFANTEITLPEYANGTSLGSVRIGVMILLDRPAPSDVTVPFTLNDPGSGNITALTPSPITIQAGQSCGFITLEVAANSGTTADQIPYVKLTAPTGATLGAAINCNLSVLDQDPATDPGRRWTLQQPKPTSDELRAISTIPGTTPRQVIAGQGNSVLTSDDHGATWTKRITSLNPEAEYQDAHWNGAFLIAPGSAGHVGASKDGIAWGDIRVPGASSRMDLRAAASNGTRAVIAGSDFVGGQLVPAIFSTTDAVHWSRSILPTGLRGNLFGVVHAAGTTSEFVAVGGELDQATGKTTTLILTSPDGLVWTDRSSGIAGINLQSVVFTGTKLVAFDGTKTGFAGSIAADGSISWTKQALGAGGLIQAAWSGTKLAAVGAATGTSTNATTWNQKPSPTKSAFTDITWTGSVFIAIAKPSAIFTSPDGVTWTKSPGSGEISDPLFAVAWSGSQFCAVGGDFKRLNTALIYTSPDGSTWTQRPSILKSPLVGIAWNGSLFCAVGGDGTIITSPDGVKWTAGKSGTTLDLKDVVWGTDQFVVVGGNETDEDGIKRSGGSIVLTSKDGLAWTRRTIPTGHPLESIAYSDRILIPPVGPPLLMVPLPLGSYFVAVGRSTFDGGASEAEVLTSTDGITWTHRSSGLTGVDFQRITYIPSGHYEGFLATDGNFGVSTSRDGNFWTRTDLQTEFATSSAPALHGIRSVGGRSIAVGEHGTIVSQSETDGVRRSESSAIRQADLYGIAASPSTIVAVGANGSIQTSSAGIAPTATTVAFINASSTLSESAGKTNVLVMLSSPLNTKATVNFTAAATGGLVLSGKTADALVPVTPLTFNPGETSKYISIIINNDAIADPGKGLTLTLTSATGGATVTTAPVGATHTLTITDDDFAPVANSYGGSLVPVNGMVNLRVNVTAGSQPLTFLWKKNGAALPAYAIGSTLPNLLIQSVSMSDAGNYTCLISNPAGSTTVTIPIGIYEMSGLPLNAAWPTTAVMTQPVSSNVICHWFKAGNPLELVAGSDIAFNANKSTITLSDATLQADTYTCKLELPGTSTPPFQTANVYIVSSTNTAPAIGPIVKLPDATVGTPYTHLISLSGGSSPVNTWSSPDLASLGLNINPYNGAIFGIPTSTVTNKVITINATNGKGTTTVKPTLTITSGPSLAAFVGTHTGIMDRHPTINSNLGSVITIVVDSKGTCTGSYTAGKAKISIVGVLQVVSPTSFFIRSLVNGAGFGSPLLRSGDSILSLTFNYDSALTTHTGQGFIGALSPGSGTSVNFRTWRPLTDINTLGTYTGRWNFALRNDPSNVGNQSLPQGHGFGSSTVTSKGVITYAGRLADGTAITGGGVLNLDGTSILYNSLYGGGGSFMAVPQYEGLSGPYPITDHTASWSKPADTTLAGARTYPAGWQPIPLQLDGCWYRPIDVDMGLIFAMAPPYNAALLFAQGGTQATAPSPNIMLNINTGGIIAPLLSSNNYLPRKNTFAITAATGAFTGKLDMNETQPNKVTITKRGAIDYFGQIVRIYDPVSETYTTRGYGFTLLPQLPDLNVSPILPESATPILSGSVHLTEYPIVD